MIEPNIRFKNKAATFAKLPLILMIISFSNFISAQSYIQIGGGMLLPKFETPPGIFWILDKDYRKSTFAVRLNYSKKIFPKDYGSIAFSYSNIKANSASGHAVPITNIDFKSYDTQLRFDFRPENWFILGLGQSFNLIPKVKGSSYGEYYGEKETFKVELSAIGFLGIIYKSLFLESTFSRGYGYAIGKEDGHFIKPLTYVSFITGYSYNFHKNRPHHK
jgi:hypothetical protein